MSLNQHDHKPRLPCPEGVEEAARKIAAILPPTPLLPLELQGRTLWCKAECLQPIGAFKIRGAWHRLSALDEGERERGVVAFSSGNHAQGVAWAAQRLNIAATIVMPEDAPAKKRIATAALGARIVSYDRATQNREEIAAQIAAESGAIVVPSFDDAWIVEGQGSAGVEMAQQMRQLTGDEPAHIIACCGGGGLASGCALALPDCAITIVEPDGWDDMGISLQSGQITPVASNAPPTLCDALQTPKVSPLTFDILRQRKAASASVSDAEVLRAMRLAFDRLRLVLEPGGAVALAAVLAGKVKIGPASIVTLSGGNVDADIFARCLEPRYAL